MVATGPRSFPEVPISAFKSNPIAYADSGAVVLVHNKPRMRVVPIPQAGEQTVAEVKARLRLLNSLLEDELVQEERRRLAAERDADLVDEPR